MPRVRLRSCRCASRRHPRAELPREDVQSDVSANASFFPFPDVEGGYEGTPLLIAGDIAGLVQEADAIRFDGSDAMPGAVGAGSFWTGMTGWVNGEIDLETALQNIEDSWPTETGDGSTEGG